MAPQPKVDGHTKDFYIGKYFEEVDPPEGKYLTYKQLYRMSIGDVAKLTNCEDDESDSDESMDYDTDEELADKNRKVWMMNQYKEFCKEEKKNERQSKAAEKKQEKMMEKKKAIKKKKKKASSDSDGSVSDSESESESEEVTKKKGKGRPASKEDIWEKFHNSNGYTPLPPKKYAEYCQQVGRDLKIPVRFFNGAVIKICKRIEDSDKYTWIISKAEHEVVFQ